MALTVRPPITTLPSYSLTSDLLGFPYDVVYSTVIPVSATLPSSHPVQLWFGQFIHAVLEEAYREVNDNGKAPATVASKTRLDDIMDRIDRRLVAQNIRCWDDANRETWGASEQPQP